MAETKSFAKIQKRVRDALGQKVKDLRHSRKRTQAELAEEAGIRRALVNQIERGHANPRLDTILRIADALKVEPAALLSLKRKEPSES